MQGNGVDPRLSGQLSKAMKMLMHQTVKAGMGDGARCLPFKVTGHHERSKEKTRRRSFRLQCCLWTGGAFEARAACAERFATTPGATQLCKTRVCQRCDAGPCQPWCCYHKGKADGEDDGAGEEDQS